MSMSVEGDKLRALDPNGFITPDLSRAIGKLKAEIIASLTRPETHDQLQVVKLPIWVQVYE